MICSEAYGAAVSDVLHTFSVSRQGPAPGNAASIAADLAALEHQARDVLGREGIPDADIGLSAWADLRYRRQFFDLRVPLPAAAAVDDGRLRDAVRRFEGDYARRYGDGARHGEDRVEYVRFGLEARGRTPQPPERAGQAVGRLVSDAVKTDRPVHWPEADEVLPTPIYDGALLEPGHEVAGPAVIEHVGTSIVIHAGQRARIDTHLNTIIDLEEGRNGSRRSSHL